jgi:hypothetical protein
MKSFVSVLTVVTGLLGYVVSSPAAQSFVGAFVASHPWAAAVGGFLSLLALLLHPSPVAAAPTK